MDKLNRRHRLLRIVLYSISTAMLVQSFLEFHIRNTNDLIFFILMVFTGVFMGTMGINIGKGYIELTDAISAFIFISFGREIATVFVLIYWVITAVVDEKLLKHHREKSRRFFTLAMFTIATYITSTVMNFITYFTYQNKALNIFTLSFWFVGIYLIVNIVIFKIDHSIESGRVFKFGRESRIFLFINFMVSVLLTTILNIVGKAAGILGSVLVLANIIIIHYCFYIYRKLSIRNEAIKGLLKTTCDIVKYGDFRDKCKHLLISLNELIPYSMCAIYTFDIDTDSVSYPVAYYSKNPIDIGELGFFLTSDAVTAKIVREGKIYVCHDIKKDKKVNITGKLSEAFHVLVIVPIVIADRIEGLILIGGDDELVEFAYNGIEDMLNILSNQMALAIENNTFYRNFKNKAEIDPLTKLYNRRVFNREVENLIKTNTNFSLVIYDLDDFKQINDSYGHLIGDEVLENVSDVIIKSIRKTDVPCRYGGEEIAIIFKDLSKEDAFIISERIRQSIESTPTNSGIGEIYVTISGGIASFPEDGITKEDIIGNADKVLYSECKRKGKNKVYVYRDIERQRHAAPR